MLHLFFYKCYMIYLIYVHGRHVSGVVLNVYYEFKVHDVFLVFEQSFTFTCCLYYSVFLKDKKLIIYILTNQTLIIT